MNPTPRGAGAFRDHPMMLACRREPAPYTPVWLMRQAGRYMPEYRRVRAQHDFLEMCQRPELAAEVTVTAVERLGVDAAIIFADILLPLVPMGVGLRYEKGGGPIIDRPVRSAADLERIPPIDAAGALGFVGDAIRMARRALGGRTPLIGFAGAPFTLASYLIEGGGSRQYQATKTMMYTEPATWHRLMETARARDRGLSQHADRRRRRRRAALRQLGRQPRARRLSALRPAAHAPRDFGAEPARAGDPFRHRHRQPAGADARGGRRRHRPRLARRPWRRRGRASVTASRVQGNLDPVALFAGVPEIRRRVRAILDQAAGRPGHIFNLGHGILPETPVDHVLALVDAVHEMSRMR